MGFLLAIFNLCRNVAKGLKKGINVTKLIISTLKAWLCGCLISVIIVMTIIIGMTSAVKGMFDFIVDKFKSKSYVEISEKLSDEELEQIKSEFGEAFNPKKISKYVKEENSSFPTSKSAKTETIENGKSKTGSCNLSLKEVTYKYRTPWQLIAALDIFKETGGKLDKLDVINKAESIRPEFQWADDKYTRDTTNYWKEYEVETVEDNGNISVTNNLLEAKENYKTEKEPLPFPSKVITALKVYTYNFTEDVKTVDEPWSEPIEISSSETIEKVEDGEEEDRSSPIYKQGSNEIEGYNKKKKYREVKRIKKKYKIVRKTVIEDQVSFIDEQMSPQKFISLLKELEIDTSDIDFLSEIIRNLPESEGLANEILAVAEGDYSNIDMGGDGGFIGDIPLFLQYDSRWGYEPYGSSGTIASSGCGVTSVAMIVTGLGGNMGGIDLNNDGIFDPSESAKYSVNNGFRAAEGTSWGYFPNIANKTGLKIREYESSQYNKVYEELKKGNPAIASMTAGHFTRGGHLMVLTGVDENGKIKVNDPGSEDRSKISWDFNIIVNECIRFWVFENPNQPVIGNRPLSNNSYIKLLTPGAMEGYKKYGLFPSITIAQAILEGGWNADSQLATVGKNIFGIKADSSWKGPKGLYKTREENADGTYRWDDAYFRHYSSISECIIDRCNFLYVNSRYKDKGVFEAKNAVQQIKRIDAAGYSTTSGYANEVLKIVKENGLQELDKIAIQGGR